MEAPSLAKVAGKKKVVVRLMHPDDTCFIPYADQTPCMSQKKPKPPYNPHFPHPPPKKIRTVTFPTHKKTAMSKQPTNI